MPTIRLDLTALTRAGALTPAEAARLQALALPAAGSAGLLVNLLLFGGAMAVAAAAIALVPDAATGLVLALLALGGGAGLKMIDRQEDWRVLWQGLAFMGVIGVSGWIALEFEESVYWPPVAIAALTAAAAVGFRSAFLSALAVLAGGAVLGSGTAYWHASYAIFVSEPTLTVLILSALSALLYALRQRIANSWSAMLTSAARTSAFLASIGFWVGSLWGDHIGEHWARGEGRWRAPREWRESALHMPEWVFSLGWAGALIALIATQPRGGFLSVSAVVFLAIHAYTQYFETFGAQPWALLIAGLTAFALAVAGARWMVSERRVGS
ncbi:MAG: hypothetical protein GVY06_01290 [Alphaproteobacteria bacterium]|jgi:hypothetical protein|nr:hypothetical protein [Alphaproteobacteria bacterium]